jgi:CDP-glucose 4,6-dehydratase
MDDSFWRGKRVFLTGHTGFKGGWLSLWLQQLGAKVTGYALEPPTDPSLFERAGVASEMKSITGDVLDTEHLSVAMAACRPEVVFHLAAQSLVRYSYEHPTESYATNVMGTLHVLESIRRTGGVRAAVMVTTDKCYENIGLDHAYREDDRLGGHDPYSSSKSCAELLVASYRNSYFPRERHASHGTRLASARAGNVIGGGDWAKDRLIPDLLRAFYRGETVHIRHPQAVRPWQHVLEPLQGYLLLARQLHQGPGFAEAWNFGPGLEDAKPVQWVVEWMAESWDEGASWQTDGGDHPHEASYLKLDSTKARTRLGWSPRWALEEALENMMAWHRAELHGEDMKTFSLGQLERYRAVKEAPR